MKTIISIVFLAMLIATPAQAATHHIRPNQDFDAQMNSILGRINNFDTIRIHGNHIYNTDRGQFTINKDIRILGDGAGVTRIKRTGSSRSAFFYITANGVSIESLTLIGNDRAQQGIRANGVSGLSVLNVAIDNCYEGPITSTGLPSRNANWSAILCVEGKSLPNLRLKNNTFKNVGWAALTMGSGHGNAPEFTPSSYGGYLVIDNCRFKRTSSSFMRMGISIDYGEDGRDYAVDFASGNNPVTSSRSDRYKNYGFIGNNTFDQMIYYSSAISRSKRIWVYNNDIRGGNKGLARADNGRFTKGLHFENNCVSLYITNNTIADMGETTGIGLAGFFKNDGDDHCKWIFMENNLFDGNSLGVTDNINVAISGGASTNCFVRNNNFNHNNTHGNGKIVAFWADTSTNPTSYPSSNTLNNITGNRVNGAPLNKNTQVVVSRR